MKSLKLQTILPLALMLALAACSDKGGDQEATAPAATETKEADTAAETRAPEPNPEKTVKDTETITSEACLAAVSKETSESKVVVISNEFSEANTLVTIGVGDNRAPWRCLVSNDGNVAEVSFTGDEGSL